MDAICSGFDTGCCGRVDRTKLKIDKMMPKKIQGKVEKKKLLAGNNWYLKIRLNEEAEYIPGQFVSLKVNEEGLRRSYSVAGRPNQIEIELVIDVTPMGMGSKFVLGLKDGDMVEVLGFLGKFVVSEKIIAILARIDMRKTRALPIFRISLCKFKSTIKTTM